MKVPRKSFNSIQLLQNRPPLLFMLGENLFSLRFEAWNRKRHLLQQTGQRDLKGFFF